MKDFSVLRTFVFLAVVLSTSPLAAQESSSDDSIFADGAFDASVAQGQAAAQASQLVWLGGVSLASNTSLLLPNGGGTYGSQSGFSGKGFLKATNPSVGSLFVSYSYNHTLWASTDDSALAAGYGLAKPDPAVPVYQLSELHLSFDLGKVVFVRLGNQLIDWGASAVWSPADFINRRVPDPSSSLDTRSGKPGLRLHAPFGFGNVFVFADASRSISKGVPQDLLHTGRLGLKIDATALGWNVGAIGNFGQDTNPKLGLTASGALFGIDLWAEAGGEFSLASASPGPSASLGGEKSFGDDSEWTLRAEGFYQPSGRGNQVIAPADKASFTPFYWGQGYAYVELVKKKFLLPAVTGSLSATGNLSDESWQGTASLRTAFPSLIPFTLYLQYNGGESNREFTLATNGPATTLGLRSTLEF